MQQSTYRRGFLGSMFMIPMQVFLFSVLFPVNIFFSFLKRVPGIESLRQILPGFYKSSDWLRGKEQQRDEPSVGRIQKKDEKRGWISSAFHLVPGSSLATSVYHYASDSAWKVIEPPSFLYEGKKEEKEEVGLRNRKREREVSSRTTETAPQEKQMVWEGGPVSSRLAPGYLNIKHEKQEKPKEEVISHRSKEDERRPKIVGMEFPVTGKQIETRRIEVTGVESKRVEIPIAKAKIKHREVRKEETELKQRRGMKLKGKVEEGVSGKEEEIGFQLRGLEKKGVEEKGKPVEMLQEVEKPKKKEKLKQEELKPSRELEKEFEKPKVESQVLPTWYGLKGLETKGLEGMQSIQRVQEKAEEGRRIPVRVQESEISKTGKEFQAPIQEKESKITTEKRKESGIEKKQKIKGKLQRDQIPVAPPPPSMEYLLSQRNPPVVWPEDVVGKKKSEELPDKTQSEGFSTVPENLNLQIEICQVENLSEVKKGKESQKMESVALGAESLSKGEKEKLKQKKKQAKKRERLLEKDKQVGEEESAEWTRVSAKKNNIPKHLREKLRDFLLNEGIATKDNVEDIALRICKVCENVTVLDKLLTFYPFFIHQHIDNPEQAFFKLNQWEGLFGQLGSGISREIRDQYKNEIENTPMLDIQEKIRMIQTDLANREKPSKEEKKATQERIDDAYDGRLEEISEKLNRTGKVSREDITKLEETTQALGGFVPSTSTSL